MTALHQAAYSGRKHMCHYLLLVGAHRNARDHSGRTPVELCRRDAHPWTYELLRGFAPCQPPPPRVSFFVCACVFLWVSIHRLRITVQTGSVYEFFSAKCMNPISVLLCVCLRACVLTAQPGLNALIFYFRLKLTETVLVNAVKTALRPPFFVIWTLRML